MGTVTYEELLGPVAMRGLDPFAAIERSFSPDPFGLDVELNAYIPYAERPPEPPPPPKRISVLSDRVIHSDKIMEGVPGMIGDILHVYFDFDWMPFHIDLLEKMFIGGKRVVNWPTDHAKSYMTSYFFPLLSLMENPNESHIICGANADDAKRRVQMIQREIETNHQLVTDFPWLKKPTLDIKQKWNTEELTVAGRSTNKPDPSVLATSTMSNDTKGRRGKLIVDDSEGEDHRNSSLKRNRLYDWVGLAALRTFEDARESKRPLSIVVGTPMDIDSLYIRLTRKGWITDIRPIYTDPKPWASSNPWDHKHTMLWPAKFEKVLEQWNYLDAAQFAISYLMDPKAGSPDRLSLEEIEALTRKGDSEEYEAKTFVSLDPASGSAVRGADYAGIVVVKIGWPKDEKLPRIEVLAATKVAYPAGYIEHCQIAADYALKYECPIIYESNAQQGQLYRRAFQHHRPEVANRLIGFHTGGAGQSTNKFDEEMGLTVVQRLVRESRLVVPESQLPSEGMQTLLKEVRDLGSTRRNVHDHLSAAVWFVVRHIYNQIRVAGGPQMISTWGGPQRFNGRNPFVDQEAAVTPAANGWGAPIRPYRRFGR